MDKLKLQDLEKVLEPLFYHWKSGRQSEESFGDFTNRMVSAKKQLGFCILLSHGLLAET